MTLILKDEHLPIPPIIAVPRRFAVLSVVGCMLLGVFLGLGFTFYYLQAHSGAARTIARWVPLPVGHVEGRVLWYRQLSERANALEALAGVSQDESMALAAVRTQREAVVVRLADALGVEVSNDEITAFIAEDEELRLLKEKAEWTERDYRSAVKAYLLSEKTELALLGSETHQAYARGRIEKLAAKIEDGIPFADLALHYSEGDAAQYSGDLGYVDVNTLPKSVAEAVASLPLGETSNILETERAFVLASVIDRLAEDANGVTMARVRVIEIKKDLLGEIVTRTMATTKIANWLR